MCKKIVSLLMAIAMLVAVTGCGDSGEPTKKPVESKPSASSESTNSKDDVSSSGEESKDETASSKTEETPKDQVIVTEVPIKTKPEEEERTIDPKFTLKGDTTVRDEIKLGKYKLVWSEEFDGNTLNTEKLQLRRDYGAKKPEILYTDDLTFLSDGAIHMRAQRYYNPENTTVKYAVGPGLTTAGTMNYERGYLEMRAKVPYKQSFWSSFWVRSATSNNGFGEPIINQTDYIAQFASYSIEMDIFEVFGSYDTASPNMHTWGFGDLKGVHTVNRGNRVRYTFDDTTFLNDEYHVYGFSWDENEMAMYVDGEKYHSYDLNVPFDQYGMEGYKRNVLFVIWGNGLVTDSEDSADGNGILRADTEEVTDLPTDYSIDWIRLYQDPNDPVSRVITKK